MKCMIVLVIALAVASAQFNQAPRYNSRAQLRPAASAVVTRRAAPPRAATSDQAANIIRYENDQSPDGAYVWSFETENGIAAQEQGTPRDFGGNPPIVPVVAQGTFAWTSPEGVPVAISYVADENGYQPQGDAIPTPPPVPPQIARALDWIARNAPLKKK